jgi:hypothetical protein
MIFLHPGDRFTDFVGHDAVYGAAVVAPVTQNDLERAHIRRVSEQFSSGLKIVKDAVAVPVSVIYRV